MSDEDVARQHHAGQLTAHAGQSTPAPRAYLEHGIGQPENQAVGGTLRGNRPEHGDKSPAHDDGDV
jgi:hypothetical protein